MSSKYLRDIPKSTISAKEVSSIKDLKSRSVQHVLTREELEEKENSTGKQKVQEESPITRDSSNLDDNDDEDYVLASSSEEEEELDEDAELLLELEKIRREKEIEKEQDAEKQLLEEALNSNSLMMNDPTIKRKWTDDVIFKNQANDEPKLKKRFINDTIRSDFHKKFLYRFVK